MARSPMRIGPYRVDRRVASGGMAEVYVAHREAAHGFERRVALKTILPQLASDPEFAAMFADEAKLAARLEHPGIAQVFDFGEADGMLYLAMELVDGASVNRMLRASTATREPTPVPLAVILHVGIEVARALAYAHVARDGRGRPLGIVHRDVSPANILLGRRGEVKLVDFGIARCLGAAHRTDEGMVRGKLGYMSPEQVQGKTVDGRSDVFTLAAVLAEMCLLEPLFGTGEDLSVLMRIRNVDLAPLERLLAAEEKRLRNSRPSSAPPNVGAPPELLRLLRAALARKPEDRIGASYFADALEEIAERRNLHGRRARETSRQLHRLGLLSLDPADVEAREPGARPTTLVATRDSEPPSTSPTDRPAPAGANELLAAIALEPPTHYELVSRAGVVLGPLSYAELVRRIVAGEVGPELTVRREGTEGGEPPELRRYLSSSALGWKDAGAASARERGVIESGRLLSLALRLGTTRATGMLELVEDFGAQRRGPSTVGGEREGVFPSQSSEASSASDTRKPRRKRIFYVDGKPEFVTSNDPHELLGEFLVRNGVCLRMEIEMALAVLDRYEGRLADALVGLGVIRPMALVGAIERQVRERYLEAFRWRAGNWTFVEGMRAGEEAVPLGRGPLELLFDAAVALDANYAEAAIAPLRERVVTRVITPPAPLVSFGLPSTWSRAILAVDGRTTLSGLLMRARTEHGLEVDDACRVYHFGLSCSLLRAASSPASAMGIPAVGKRDS
ncbi:MAG: protein kinase [Deltaproteobacteria bacterium]|nr:protein kinase [Deltaproteobacteria bacterium]